MSIFKFDRALFLIVLFEDFLEIMHINDHSGFSNKAVNFLWDYVVVEIWSVVYGKPFFM